MNNKLFTILIVLVAMLGFWAPSTSKAQDEECEPVVELTSAGVTLRECEAEDLVVVAEQMASETNPTAEGQWEIRWLAGATAQMRGHGRNAWPAFEPANPALWPEFPDVDNEAADFSASQGVEYGMAESDFFQTGRGNLQIAAMHYRLVTGDYDLGFDQCSATEEFQGCAIALINVGVSTSFFEDVSVLNGFTVWGRYWDGDQLPVAIVALLSHAANNMLNLESTLNPGGTNAGSNCSIPSGCERVRLTFVILSGNEVLAIGRTFVSRPE